MRLSWPQHLQAARLIELSGEEQRGQALGLMGISLLLLLEDLLDLEAAQSVARRPPLRETPARHQQGAGPQADPGAAQSLRRQNPEPPSN